jgi:hypothetical protein
MTTILITLTIIITGIPAVVLDARLIVRASYHDRQALILITILGCGPAFDITAGQAGFALGPWHYFFRPHSISFIRLR